MTSKPTTWDADNKPPWGAVFTALAEYLKRMFDANGLRYRHEVAARLGGLAGVSRHRRVSNIVNGHNEVDSSHVFLFAGRLGMSLTVDHCSIKLVSPDHGEMTWSADGVHSSAWREGDGYPSLPVVPEPIP